MTTAHNQDGDLATLVREHVQETEPPFQMSSDTVVALGRRTLVRRRARRGIAGLVVGAAAAVTLPMVFHGASAPAGDDGRMDPATVTALQHYDAQRMPAILDEHVRVALGDGLAGLGQAEFAARDDQGQKIPAKYYDKASSMEVRYGARTSARSVRVTLMHARGEAEGDARQNCAEDLASGYAFTCEVTTSAAGDTVVTRVMAARPMGGDEVAGWGAVTSEELRTGIPAKGDPSHKPIDPNEVYFIRTVESVHSETFLVAANETVKAPSFEGAQQAFQVPVYDLEKVVTDPELVIPKPPLGEGGCPWTWKMKVTCSKK